MNRHASSRPEGISKASTSNDVNTSPLFTAGPAAFSERAAPCTPVATTGEPVAGVFFASAVI